MHSKTKVVSRNRVSNATRFLSMLVMFAALVSGLYFLAPSQRPTAAPRVLTQPSSGNSVDACGLISQSEIASIQGVQVQGAQPSSQKQGDLVIAQCYYAAVSNDGRANLSVYLQLIRPDANGSRRDALEEFWKDRFARDKEEREREEEKREAENEEGEERINEPVRVAGLGSQAFWLGTSRGGALYVLKGDSVLRVTVGGADVKTQMEKSKALARKILKRLA